MADGATEVLILDVRVPCIPVVRFIIVILIIVIVIMIIIVIVIMIIVIVIMRMLSNCNNQIE